VSAGAGQACGLLVGEIRAAWGWLAEQRVPGPTASPSERHISVEQQRVEDREARRDRAARNPPEPPPVSRGLPSGAGRAALGVHPPIAAGPHRDAARLSPIHGRIIVAAQLRAAADGLHAAVFGAGFAWALSDPSCRAVGESCGVCGGGRCGCDVDDAQAAAALAVIGELLRRGDAPDEALSVLWGALERANREARRAAGVADVCLVLKAACPACDSRDMVADCTSPRREDWSIRCRNTLCRCAGPGCRCGCAIRYPGKQHVWPADGGGWHDLAARLGVAYPLLVAQATGGRP
jgi:hypothetical protein